MLLAAAMLLLRPRRAQLLVEPALAAGALIVIGYGMSERLLPGVLHFARSVSAEGRLEQPLTYWNAMGELAALGFVLCARAGGRAPTGPRRCGSPPPRPPRRSAMGLYMSFSRGALFACVAGLVALVVLAPRARAAARARGRASWRGVAGVAWRRAVHGVTAMTGRCSTRERQGAIVLALLVVITLAAAAVPAACCSRASAPAQLRAAPAGAAIALGLIGAGLALAIVVGAKESSTAAAERRRHAAGDAAEQPLRVLAAWRCRRSTTEPMRGVGAGGWAV